MASSFLLLIAAMASAGLGAAALAWFMLDNLRKRKIHAGVHRQVGAGGFVRSVLWRGIAPFAAPARMLLRLRMAEAPVSRMVVVLQLRGIACTPESLGSTLMALSAALFVVGFAMGSWVAGVAFSVCMFAAGSAWASHVFERRRDEIREALPDALRAMGACFHAGYTLQQTFGQLQHELKGPIGNLFGSARDAMETGATAREALSSLRGSSIVPELSFISVALDVQHRAGGSMRHVLDSACESLESELELRRSLRVHTAQARLSARVVTGVTFGLVGVLSLLSDDFLGPFFASALGMALLAIAVLMQCAGVLVVRKMLKVEVD